MGGLENFAVDAATVFWTMLSMLEFSLFMIDTTQLGQFEELWIVLVIWCFGEVLIPMVYTGVVVWTKDEGLGGYQLLDCLLWLPLPL